MNGKQRIECVLNGQWPDKRPVMLHNFRMAAQEAGFSMAQYRSDPNVIAKAHIQAVEMYQLDGIFLDIDTVTLVGALGVSVDFPENEPARCHKSHPLLTSLNKVDELPTPNLMNDERVQIWVESCRLLKMYFGDEVWIRGNADQLPYSAASMMRGMTDWMMELMDPELEEAIFSLLEYCYKAGEQFVRMIAETGVHMISHGDSSAGPDMIDPRMYRRFAQPYEQRMVRLVRKLGKAHMLHICGNTDAILDDMAATGSNAIELDYKTDIQLIKQQYGEKITLSGILDPSAVLGCGTPDDVERKCRYILEVYQDSPRLIVCSGCALPPNTPPENIYRFVQTVRSI